MISKEKLRELKAIIERARGYYATTPLSGDDVDELIITIEELQAENERLMELMPRIGGTCRHNEEAFCMEDRNIRACQFMQRCPDYMPWELKNAR